MGNLVSVEIHKGPWQTSYAVEPKAPRRHQALEHDCFDIIYVLVRFVVESDKEMEEHLDLWSKFRHSKTLSKNLKQIDW
jgi:hypothetical protein